MLERAGDEKLSSILLAAVLVVSGAGLVAEIGAATGHGGALTSYFSLSFEGNFPTWYASCLLAAAAILLTLIAWHAENRKLGWWCLAAVFAFMSLDEATEIHERLGGLVDGHGVLYFSWVIPGAAIVVVLGLGFLPFLGHLEPRLRRRFIYAGAIYITGALLMDLPLGWWMERAGDQNLTYGLIDWLEETLELIGASLFVRALAVHVTEIRK